MKCQGCEGKIDGNPYPGNKCERCVARSLYERRGSVRRDFLGIKRRCQKAGAKK